MATKQKLRYTSVGKCHGQSAILHMLSFRPVFSRDISRTFICMDRHGAATGRQWISASKVVQYAAPAKILAFPR